MGDTHVHVSGDFTGRVEVAGDATVIITGVNGVAAEAVSGTTSGVFDFPGGDKVEDLISRHEKRFKGKTRSRDVATTLLERGWKAYPGPKYNRFIFKGSAHKVTLYQNGLDLGSKEHRDALSKMPHADVRKNEVRFVTADGGFDAAMGAVEKIEAWANGKVKV